MSEYKAYNISIEKVTLLTNSEICVTSIFHLLYVGRFQQFKWTPISSIVSIEFFGRVPFKSFKRKVLDFNRDKFVSTEE